MKTLLALPLIALMAAPLPPQEDHKLGEDVTARFEVPDGLEVRVWAQSPQFFNPTNMDVDARGRIWVTEGVNYRGKHSRKGYLKHPKGDRIMILEDTDGDGTCDSSKVFVQDEELLVPLGIGVFGKEIVVSCSPKVFIYTDEDGDDKPDRKEVLLDGFRGRDHDHGVHAFIGGPDGRWYFNCGNSGAGGVKDRSGNVFRTGRNRNGRSFIQGVALRIEPDGTSLACLGHNFRNNYELTIDAFGNIWQNDNDDDGNRSCRVTYVMEGGNYGYKSADDTRNWKLDRRPGQPIPDAHWHLDDPGVVPPNDVTGAGAPTGIVLYEGDVLPKKIHGMVLSCDSGRSTLFGLTPAPGGRNFKTQRIVFMGAIKDAVKNAQWFRPADVAVGTDGAVYVADWYDPGVGGHNMRDGKGYGRIFRITPKGSNPKRPAIDLSTTEGQIAALKNPAINVRYQAWVKLAAQGEKALPALEKLYADANPRFRARAMWLIARSRKTVLKKALADDDPSIRIAAFRAARQLGHDVLKTAAAMARDPSAAVRREVAVALRDVPFSESREILLDLAAGYDGENRHYLEAFGLACEGKEEDIYPDLLEKLGDTNPAKWSEKFAGLVWRLHPVRAIDALKARARSSSVSPEGRKQAVVALAFIKDEKAADAMVELARGGPDDVKREALWWANHRSRNHWRKFNVRERLK